ncbi:AAA family ATPase [Actinoplanes subtropicus]|uniref:AAA family ATPase n=1 Tax=Actinoplanes subtropicus TaxID=543632 RepID=UPI0004C41FFD|nr:MoxR family ATPase [Actinoplanes subtropicus]
MPLSLIQFADRFQALHGNITRVIHGKPDVIRMALTCLFAQGHLLIEDVPGVAKTSLAKAIAASVAGSEFRRIQFTPDLLPSDVTGVDVFNPDRREFEFRPGPVFANVLLGDEINRASPRTQSALLQVMAEGEVTVGLRTYQVVQPFFCIATQNPSDHHGTYPLPESQLDRFLMRISVGYPQHHDEMAVVEQAVAGPRLGQLPTVLRIGELTAMRAAVRQVEVGAALRDYVVRVAAATRTDDKLRLGVSPRGTIALAVGAQVIAATQGRPFATAEDVRVVAVPVLLHRLLPKPEVAMPDAEWEKRLVDLLDAVPTPPRR